MYAYDGAGNIKTIGPDHFYYDLASRLTEGTTSAGTKAQQLAYDAYGNITSRTNNGTNTGYTIQASTNRATAVGGTSWGYEVRET